MSVLSALDPVAKAQGTDDSGTVRRIGGSVDEALAALAASALQRRALDALRAGNAAAVVGALDWDTLSYALADALQLPLAGVYLSKGYRAMFDLSPATAVLDFETLEPRAIAWATQQAGRRVVEVSQEVRSRVGMFVTDALQGQAGDVHAAARRIQRVVPLTQRWRTAVENTRERVYTEGVKRGLATAEAEAKADAAANRQAQRLRKVRSENIARTEIMTASNAGRFEGWTVEIGNGNAATDSRKEWTVGNEACPHICDPMHGEVVLWDQPFSGGFMMPPAHVGCRCTGVLLPPDVPLRGPTGAPPRPTVVAPRSGTGSSRRTATTQQRRSNPDKGRRRNAGDLTNEQGQAIAASSMRLARGEQTLAEHRAYVRQLTDTDSRGRSRS